MSTVKERTRTSDLFIEDAIEVGTTALTTKTTKQNKTTNKLGPLALLAAGVLGLAAVVTATDTPPEPEVNLKLRGLQPHEVTSLPRYVTDEWPVHETTYFTVGFKKALNQPDLLLALSKLKNSEHEMLYLHYPDSPVPNPLFEGGLASFQALGDALRRRLELVPGLEGTVGEVQELVEQIGEIVPTAHKDILFAPVESYVVTTAPPINVHRATEKVAVFVIVGQNKHNAPICNDFPMIHCLEDGKLALTWANDETARTCEGTLTAGVSTLESLIFARLSHEWKDRYRVTDKEEATRLSQAIAKHIWISIPSEWTGTNTKDSISLAKCGLTFELIPEKMYGVAGYKIMGKAADGQEVRHDFISFTPRRAPNGVAVSFHGEQTGFGLSVIPEHLIMAITHRFTNEWHESLRLELNEAQTLAKWIYDQHVKNNPSHKL